MNEIPIEIDEDLLLIGEQFANYTDIKAYGMHWSKDDQGSHLYNLFAILTDSIIKVSYMHDSYDNKITQSVIENELYDLSEQYDGNNTRAEVTIADFVVSCSDCRNPSVKWYDHDLNLVHTEEM